MPTIKHKLVGSVSYTVLPQSKNGTIPIDIDNSWEQKNIVKVFIPQLVGVEDGTAGGSDGWIRWYKGGVYQLKEAFKEIEAKGLVHLIKSFAGSYYPRMIRGSTRTPSEHSFGTALDINAAWNPLGRVPAAWGTVGSVRELVAIFEKWGFRWGGYFSRKDGMHFELARLIPEPKQQAIPAEKPNGFRNVEVTFNGKPLDGVLRDKELFLPVRDTLEGLGMTVHALGDHVKGYDVKAYFEK